MPRTATKEVLSDDFEIEQKPPITAEPNAERAPDIILVDKDLAKALTPEYRAELAFNEEPVNVRLELSSGDNAVQVFPIWNNGKGCELLVTAQGRLAESLDENGKWMPMPNGFVPVGIPLVMKRKYLATLASSKQDRVKTLYGEPGSPFAGRNEVDRGTSSSQVFSVLEDRNPKGRPWLREIMRRNF